jgi:MFS transporter, AAHS family, 4-hydroxybenzoate transporter
MASKFDVEEAINKGGVNRFQLMIAIVSTAVLIADGFDLQIISYLMPKIIDEWGMSPAYQGTIMSSGYLGVMLGYLLLSPLAPRFGLKRMIVTCLLVMGMLNVATVLADTPTQLIAFRVATGIALGGVFPPAIALTVEYFPERYRSSVVTIIYVGLPLGFLLAGSAAWLVVPQFGWRGAMVVGGAVPALLAGLVAVFLPESIEYLLNRAKGGEQRARVILSKVLRTPLPERAVPYIAVGEKGSSSTLNLFRNGRTIGTLALWLGLSLNAMVYFFVLSWLPSILVNIGLNQQDAILASSLTNVGGIFAAFITGPLMDRFGGFKVVVLHFLVGAGFAIAVGGVLAPEMMIVVPVAFCLGFCVSGLQKGISALAMKFYPIQLRSTGLGWVFGIGRTGAIVGPLLAGALMSAGWKASEIFYFMGVPLLLGGVGIGVMWYRYGPRRRPALPAVSSGESA